MKPASLVIASFLVACPMVWANNQTGRTVLDFNDSWRFARGFSEEYLKTGFNDSDWLTTRVPHDWAISGPFDPKADGKTGKLPWKGEGCYRKSFTLPAEARGKRIICLFNGVMCSPQVFVNGKKAGEWDYGYNSFFVDLTEFVDFDRENVMTVHVNTGNFASRWYPGAGIYRKVTLLILDQIHMPVWGTFVTTPSVTKDLSAVDVKTEIVNKGAQKKRVQVVSAILSPAGNQVAGHSQTCDLDPNQTRELQSAMTVDKPDLWDVDNPILYTLRTTIKDGTTILDQNDTPFGIRKMEFTVNDGFHLNGRRVQLKGVNLHHDHGPLGAAFLPRAMQRQIEIMKDMGVNAIRTSHNMPDPGMLDLCDRMGILVFCEGFDKWDGTMGLKSPEVEFKAAMERNAVNWIRRDRNHPSVMLWSMCNENYRILTTPWGAEGIKFCVDLYKKLDPTRPVCLADFRRDKLLKDAERAQRLQPLDIMGWNYQRSYAAARKMLPDKPLIYSESSSALSTRGYYEFPHPAKMHVWSKSHQVESYDLSGRVDLPEVEFARMAADKYVAGEFVWSGFDYIGEPTPFDQDACSSYYGIVDLCGIPKDRFFLYRSHWNEKDTTMHILPDWNWPDRVGRNVPVYVYTSGDEAELFLNGKSMGKRKKLPPDAGGEDWEKLPIIDGLPANANYGIVDRYRLRWEDVIYQPGELKAVVYKNGRKIGEKTVRTAGPAEKIRLVTDRTVLKADGDDLCYVLVEMLDKDGNLCSKAEDMLTFKVEGAAKLAGVGNGNSTSLDSFTDDKHPLFFGKAMLIVRTIKGLKGPVKISVHNGKANAAEVTINTM